jgi:sulfane dehydrogenase subunit SoxC
VARILRNCPPAPTRCRRKAATPTSCLPAQSLGRASEGYGKPSKYEANVQRRQSPGLTPTRQASVSFAPLQSLFGIVTPSGLHFERHHQGWWDIDPSQHRLMVNGWC